VQQPTAPVQLTARPTDSLIHTRHSERSEESLFLFIIRTDTYWEARL